MTSLLTPVLLLRVASGLTLLFAAGHAMGAIDSWSPPGDTDVLRSLGPIRNEPREMPYRKKFVSPTGAQTPSDWTHSAKSSGVTRGCISIR